MKYQQFCIISEIQGSLWLESKKKFVQILEGPLHLIFN